MMIPRIILVLSTRPDMDQHHHHIQQCLISLAQPPPQDALEKDGETACGGNVSGLMPLNNRYRNLSLFLVYEVKVLNVRGLS